MVFKDLGDALDGAHLDLPIRGKTYRVEDVDAATGLMVERIMHLGIAIHADEQVDPAEVELLDDGGEKDLYRRVLGGAYEEMVTDKVGWAAIKHAGMTVMVWILRDTEAAEQYWASGGGSTALGEVLAPAGNRASRRASSAAANKTPRPGSTSGTKAPRQGQGRGRSRGPRSSNNGRS